MGAARAYIMTASRMVSAFLTAPVSRLDVLSFLFGYFFAWLLL
jgi:hypothetical protein